MIKTHILIASDDDYSFIRSNRRGSYKTPWMVPKNATPGDNAILFHRGAGFVATAEIMTSPKRAMFRNQTRYKADIQAKTISPVSFATIIKKVPNWKWTNYPKGYTTIEGDIEKRVWDLIANKHSDKQRSPEKPRAAAAYLFLWNPKKDSESFENYDRVLRNATSGKSYTTRWICPSIKPKIGDLAIVQRTGNANNGVFAMGHITRAPFENNGNRVVGLKLDSFLPVGSEITRTEIVEAANYKKTWSPMASGNIIPDELLLAIRSLWAVRTGHSNATQVLASRATAGGAGFGNPDDNKEVETAAIAFVTNMYESKGWHVKSVENEKCGFDLICTNGETIENVEVKGIRGDGLNFNITTGELEEAKKNNKFILYAVTQALSVPHSNKFNGAELSEMFNMVPLQYRAIYKKQNGF